ADPVPDPRRPCSHIGPERPRRERRSTVTTAAEPTRYRFPAAFAQERIWFVQQLDPSSPAFVIAAALDASGPLDPVAVQRALDALVHRHESLRTSFSLDEGRPVQWVWAEATVPVTVTDLSALPEAAAEAAVTELVRQHSATAFDLTRAPL